MTEENFDLLSRRLDKIESDFIKLADEVAKMVFSQPIAALPKSQKQLSVKEFLLSKKAKSETQKTLLLGYFLENYLSFSSFNTSDLENVFRQAKEPLPKNINDTVNKNIAKGFLMEAAELKDNKKAWTLTNTGEMAVENNFKK
jgi:hypothetical protein